MTRPAMDPHCIQDDVSSVSDESLFSEMDEQLCPALRAQRGRVCVV